MQGERYGLLLSKLTGLIVLFVLINSILYIELIPTFFEGLPTYYPFIITSIVAMVVSGQLVWRFSVVDNTSLRRSLLCLFSVLGTGAAVVLLSLLIILNTLGS
jgi:hypothetical protein